MYRIKLINNIASEGIALFDEGYQVGEGIDNPHGIVVRSSQVKIDDYPELLAVARAGAGVNNIPVDRASDKGICVFNTPGANANAVVELVFTMLGIWLRNVYNGISFCHGLQGLDEEKLNHEVESRKKLFKGEEKAGKTLGVLGLGNIGVGVANAGIHRQMEVIGFDPFPVLHNIHDLSPEVVLARSQADMLKRADYVSLHVPLNKNTEKLVSYEFINSMKEGALLINYARGPVVDENAVLKALEEGKLQGYITDFPSAELLKNDKVLSSPHLGASTAESEENCARMAVNELKSYLEYGNISHSVNFPNIESIPTVKIRTRLIMINRDEPGMIALVSNILGGYKINISSYINESNGTIGYNIIDCEDVIPDSIKEETERHEGIIKVRIIRY